jgi:hypothetical protein
MSTWRVARNDVIPDDVPTYVKLSGDPENPVAIPMKFADGSAEFQFFHVSNVTATPGIPANPRPPPNDPNAVAPADGFANTNAIPSAPVPPPIVASNDTDNPADATADGYNA